MNAEQLEKAKAIEEDIKKTQKCVDMFKPEGHDTPHREDFKKRWSTGQLLMELVKPNKVKITPKGYFGGGYIEVDKEFVDMCLSHFKEKLKDKKKQLADL